MEKFTHLNHSRHFFRMVIVTIFVILIGTIVYATLQKTFISFQIKRSAQNGKFANSTLSNFDPQKPWLAFTQETAESFIIKGFSEGKNIDGYDILIGINPEQYEITKIESVHSSFQIYQFNKENYITVTGVKQLSVTAPTVFTETPLLKVTLKPKTLGVIHLALLDSVKKEQTKFVDEKVNVISPQLQSLTVEIK